MLGWIPTILNIIYILLLEIIKGIAIGVLVFLIENIAAVIIGGLYLIYLLTTTLWSFVISPSLLFITINSLAIYAAGLSISFIRYQLNSSFRKEVNYNIDLRIASGLITIIFSSLHYFYFGSFISTTSIISSIVTISTILIPIVRNATHSAALKMLKIKPTYFMQMLFLKEHILQYINNDKVIQLLTSEKCSPKQLETLDEKLSPENHTYEEHTISIPNNESPSLSLFYQIRISYHLLIKTN